MSRRGWWTVGFLGVTALAVGAELVAALDHNPDTVPWTDLIAQYVPQPVTFAAIAILCAWLPAHFAHAYRKRHPPEGDMTIPLPPTQVRHPWRATARTVAAVAVALLPALPSIASAAGVSTVPIVIGILGVAATVTRVLAMPAVEAVLRQYAPWLAAAGR